MNIHPDVLAAHAQFGGDLELMQKAYEHPDLVAEVARLRAALVEERKRALEEAAKWHDAQIAELDERIAENNAYSLRNGHNATGGANEYCRDLQTSHRLSAAAIRSLMEKPERRPDE